MKVHLNGVDYDIEVTFYPEDVDKRPWLFSVDIGERGRTSEFNSDFSTGLKNLMIEINSLTTCR